MCAEASTVLRALAADFFFNRRYLEIPSDNRIRHIPRCVHYHALGVRLKRSNDTSGRNKESCATFLLVPLRMLTLAYNVKIGYTPKRMVLLYVVLLLGNGSEISNHTTAAAK
jgi:hypothetical protein